MNLFGYRLDLLFLVLLQIVALTTFVTAVEIEKAVLSSQEGEASSSKDVQPDAANAKLLINSEDAVEFVECLEEHIYESGMPKFDVQFRQEHAIPSRKQFRHFMKPNYAIKYNMEECVAYNRILRDLEYRVFSLFWKWVEESILKLNEEFDDIGKERTIVGYDGKETKVTKMIKYWRRMAIPIGLALRNAYYILVKHLVDKLTEAVGVSHHGGNAEAEAADGTAVLKTKKSLESLNWLAKWMQYQVETNEQIFQKTFLKTHLKLNEYSEHIEQYKKALTHISVTMNKPIQFALPQKVKRVIWAVREIKYWEFALKEKQPKKVDDQEKATKEEQRMEKLLIEVFRHIPHISRIMAGEIGSKDGVKKPGSPSHRTAIAIQKKLFPHVKIEIEQGLNTDFFQGNTKTVADDGYYEGVVKVLEKVLANQPLKRMLHSVHGKIIAEFNNRVFPAAGDKHEDKDAANEEPLEMDITNWVAPGEENAEHILLVGDVGSMISMQSIVTGTYKYVMKGSISKYVQLQSPEQEYELFRENFGLRLVYGSETAHLKSLFEKMDPEAMKEYFQT